jgi:hypothetical protein
LSEIVKVSDVFDYLTEPETRYLPNRLLREEFPFGFLVSDDFSCDLSFELELRV